MSVRFALFRIALTAWLLSYPSPGLAAEPKAVVVDAAQKAFADLRFGDSETVVRTKLRGRVVQGDLFGRRCYGCPVFVRIGEDPFSIETDHHAGGLWQVRLRREVSSRGEVDLGR